jgi:hypothetical protein
MYGYFFSFLNCRNELKQKLIFTGKIPSMWVDALVFQYKPPTYLKKISDPPFNRYRTIL